MKKILLALAIIGCLAYSPPDVQAQMNGTTYMAVTPPLSVGGQMVNVLNDYHGLAPAFGASRPDGAYLDTMTNGVTLHLNIAKPGKQVTSVDTLIPASVIGDGKISFTATYLKISGTPAGYCYIEQSYDAVIWNEVPGIVADTITNVSGLQIFTYNILEKFAPFYRWTYTTTGTQVGSATGYYYLMRREWWTH